MRKPKNPPKFQLFDKAYIIGQQRIIYEVEIIGIIYNEDIFTGKRDWAYFCDEDIEFIPGSELYKTAMEARLAKKKLLDK